MTGGVKNPVKKSWGTPRFSIFIKSLIFLLILPLAVSAQQYQDFSNPTVRADNVRRLAQKNKAAKARAENWALTHNVPLQREVGGTIFGLRDVNEGRPIYNVTYNAYAAITTGADLIRETWPYDANGFGFIVGVWDAGSALNTHQELSGRVTLKDGAASASHSTHVTGTIAALGIDSGAKGMAPAVNIYSFDWNNDTDEMAAVAASYPNEEGTIYASNHSYGYAAGWTWDNVSGHTAWHWYGDWDWANSYERLFGQYDTYARDYDEVAYDAPYYLIFKAAGNDRGDQPDAGETVYYTINGSDWYATMYSIATCPQGDGEVKAGYDTIANVGVAKNVMTVGAVYDAVSSGVRNLANATMTSFSCWGPADDGRIKPDIVANGTSLRSCNNSSNSSYTTMTGTSMATPNAAGSAILLADYYRKLWPEQAMKSSSLKGLIIHTTDDLGNAGPDYKFGWGLMNVKAAADLLKEHKGLAGNKKMFKEELLNSINNSYNYVFHLCLDSDVKVTICWTDPEGNATTKHDNSTARLKNDLDLRVVSLDGQQVYYPYILDKNNPSATAGRGDNVVDNVEQINISYLPAGFYFIQVSHKGILTNSQQYYSLFSTEPFGPISDLENMYDVINNWLSTGPAGDLNSDGIVNLRDFAQSAMMW